MNSARVIISLTFLAITTSSSLGRNLKTPLHFKSARSEPKEAIRELKSLIRSLNQTVVKGIEQIKEDVIYRANEVQTRILLNLRCPQTRALGMENGEIKDNQLSSSSTYRNNPIYGPKNARLNKAAWPRGWAAKYWTTDQWLQVNFKKLTIVTGIATQGYALDSDFVSAWVKTYVLAYSMDGSSWCVHKNGGKMRIFEGNKDKNTVVRSTLMQPISTVLLKICPKTWRNDIALRIEFYGCYP